MWITLLIAHACWRSSLSARSRTRRSACGRRAFQARQFPGACPRPSHPVTYVTAVIILYVITAIVGGYIYTNYRISARFTLEQGHFWKTFGAFELKEHFIALGLGLLPAYWYFWTSAESDAYAKTRAMLTTFLAFMVWWGFLVGHLTNNVRGLGT